MGVVVSPDLFHVASAALSCSGAELLTVHACGNMAFLPQETVLHKLLLAHGFLLQTSILLVMDCSGMAFPRHHVLLWEQPCPPEWGPPKAAGGIFLRR